MNLGSFGRCFSAKLYGGGHREPSLQAKESIV